MGINQEKRSLLRSGGLCRPATRMPWVRNDSEFTEGCSRCGKCIESCLPGVLFQGEGGYPQVDFSAAECVFCGDCVSACSEDLFRAKTEKPWDITASISPSCLNNQFVYCRSCAEACGNDALYFTLLNSVFVAPSVNANDCSGCGACISDCPVGAIGMVEFEGS